MDNSFKVKLGSVKNMALFVATCNTYDCDIDLQCGRYIIDAKSLLGVLSISPEHICKVCVRTDDLETIEQLKQDVRLWIEEENFDHR